MTLSDNSQRRIEKWSSYAPDTDALEDYDADLNDFEPLGQQTAQSILNRRRKNGSSRRPPGDSAPVAPPAEKRDLAENGTADPGPSDDPADPNSCASLTTSPAAEDTGPALRIRHQPELCAHGIQERVACSRCAEICPADAIDASGDRIRIDPVRCNGCALCTLACPTGAMAVPDSHAQHLLADVQRRIADTRKAGHPAPIVVFHSPGADSAAWLEDRARLDRPVLRFPLAEVGHAGPDVWLGTIAYGAVRVILHLPADAPYAWKHVLTGVLDWAGGALTEIGPGSGRIDLAVGDLDWDAAGDDEEPVWPPATFSPYQSKRDSIRCSITHLAACETSDDRIVPLPEGAPFGAVAVNAACTLCTACAGVCPTEALSIAGAGSELRFEERACIQCRQCQQVCPERAVDLYPRMIAAISPHPSRRLLHSEAPFACIGCGRPFATAGMVQKMVASLGRHWMYRKEKEMRLLKMCRDCRVKALFQASGTGNRK